MIKVWIVWYYDNAVCPDKQLWTICKSEDVATDVVEQAHEENPDWEFEIEEHDVVNDVKEMMED